MPSVSLEELRRLEALRRYDILDTPPEEQFDRVVRLAARWFEVPISLVTLLDEDRQWFKACVGIDRQETSREVSFCAYNIYDDEVLVVEDATEDPRFEDNSLVTGPPGIRFYAGAPLVAPGGHIVGSLCVIDTKPRRAESMDLGALRDLAAVVVDELELRLASETLQERNQQIQKLTRALTEAEEIGRSHLSHLLHEDLQQLLEAARMTVGNLRDDPSLTDRQAERLQRAVATIGEAVDVTRSLSSRFAPAVGNQPLHATLKWLATRMKEYYDLLVSVRSRGKTTLEDETLKTLLYRAVRELLFSVVKHANATEVWLYLVGNQQRVRVAVEDGGGEFSQETLSSGGSVLADIRERIGAFGGRLDVREKAGKGIRAVVEVPRPDGGAYSDGWA